MTRADLLAFLGHVGVGSLEAYLTQFGPDPLRALDERLQWAAWNFRAPEHEREARFLMQHHGLLREVLDEGEAPWHLRHKRAEMAAGGRRRAPGLPGRLVAAGTPAPQARRVLPPPVSHSIPHRRDREASEAQTFLREPPPSESPTLIDDGPPTEPGKPGDATRARQKAQASINARRAGTKRSGPPARPRAHLPAGLLNTLSDLDPAQAYHAGGLELTKTAHGDRARPGRLNVQKTSHGGEPAAPPRPAPAPLAERGGGGLVVLGVGLGIAGLGLLAIAAALLLGGVGGDEPAEPPIVPGDIVPGDIAPAPPLAPSKETPRVPASRAALVSPPSVEPVSPPVEPVSPPVERPPSRIVGADLRGNWVGTATAGDLFVKIDWQRDGAVAGHVAMDLGRGAHEFEMRGSYQPDTGRLTLRDEVGGLVFDGALVDDRARGTWRFITETGEHPWFVVRQ